MVDIFQEVDEALQKDRLMALWDKYHLVIIGGVAALILGTAGWSGWTSWTHAHNKGETSRLISALEGTAPETALKGLAEDMSGGHETIALMTLAGTYVQQDKIADAAQIFEKIFTQSSAPQTLKELARLYYVRTQMTESLSAESGKKLIDILTPVIERDKSPWQYHARLDAAVISAHALKDPASAMSYLSAFDKAEGVSSALADKASALKQVYGADLSPASQASDTSSVKE